jgi:membrane protein YdbS with pleckstrin-like domain
MATKLLAGESMVLPTIRKHWIVILSSLFWPGLLAVVLLLTTSVPAIAVRSMGRKTELRLDSTFEQWLFIASVAIAVLVGLALLGLEFRSPRAPALGCAGGMVALVAAVVLATLLRLVVRDAALVVVITLVVATAVVGVSAWWSWLSWKLASMTITDQRVILDQGVIQRASKVIPLDRVQDVSTTQSVLGRLLDYGNLEIDTAGAIPNERFDYARHPDMLRDQVFVLSEQLRRG